MYRVSEQKANTNQLKCYQPAQPGFDPCFIFYALPRIFRPFLRSVLNSHKPDVRVDLTRPELPERYPRRQRQKSAEIQLSNDLLTRYISPRGWEGSVN